MIKYEFIDNKQIISPCKINQDFCEHHFVNVRQNFFSRGAPTETEAMASMVKSIFIGMDSIQKTNCGMMQGTDYNTTQHNTNDE